MTPPDIPGGQRVGPNIIEDDREDAAQQHNKRIRKKEKETTAQKTQMWYKIKHTTDHWFG